MKNVFVKHFQYTGIDDYEKALDVQINDFLIEKNLTAENVMDVKYASHGFEGSNAYSAMVIYKS